MLMVLVPANGTELFPSIRFSVIIPNMNVPLLKTKVVCPHCHLQSANDKVCTNLGCGKRIAEPVRSLTRTRRKPAAVLAKRARRWLH